MPTGVHNLEQRRYRAPLKVPVGMATAICKDKALLKPLMVYFSIKPLYYSGVLLNAKSRYCEIAEYIGISSSNLRSKLAWLKKHHIVWFDKKKNLHLCGLEKLCNFINQNLNTNLKNKKCHEIRNEGRTEYRLRALAIHESRLKQTEAVKAKVFSHERCSDEKGIIPTKAWERYHKNLTECTYKNRKLRQQKNRMLRTYTPFAPKHINLVDKYEKLYQSNMRGDGRDGVTQNQHQEDEYIETCPSGTARIVPRITLSCTGISRLFGQNSSSSGYYWEQKLKDMGLLYVKGKSLRIKNTNSLLRSCIRLNGGYYNAITHERVPLFTRITQKGEHLLFLTLSNQIVPEINSHHCRPDGKPYKLCV